LVDWLNNQILPAKQLRLSTGMTLVVFPVALVAITIFLLVLKKGKITANKKNSNHSSDPT
jgi:hypothetical protein